MVSAFGEVGENDRERLHSVFRSHMLMTSELMSHLGAVDFLEMLNSSQDFEWGKIADLSQAWLGSLDSALRCLRSGFGISTLIFHEATEHRARHPSSMETLDRMLRTLQMPRLGLYEPRTCLRYFDFAGTVVAQLNSTPLEDVPERQFSID